MHAEEDVDLEGDEDEKACPDRVFPGITLEIKLLRILLGYFKLLLDTFVPAIAATFGATVLASCSFLFLG